MRDRHFPATPYSVRDVFIVGVGQTPVTRNGAAPGRELAAKAIGDAMHAAGIEGDAVDALFVGNMTGAVLDQQQQMGSLIADYAGLSGIEAVNVEAACASGAAAARLAYLTLAGGVHEVAVVCGIERMTQTTATSCTPPASVR